MKNLMFYTLLSVVFVLFDNTLAQTYTVEIEVNDVWWHSTENFGPDLTAVIYENGNPIPPSEDYFSDRCYL